MPDTADQPSKPPRTWRPMAAWTAGILLVLGSVWFLTKLWASAHRINTLAADYAVLADDPKHLVDDLGGPDRALPELSFYVRLPAWAASERPYAAQALGYCGKPALPILMRLLQSADPGLRYGSAWALCELRHDASPAVSRLIPLLLEEDNKPVRLTASVALEHIGPAAHPAVPQLILMLSDNDAQIRYSAASALGGIGPAAKQAIPTLEKALQDTDQQASNMAGIALGRIRGEEPNP